MTWAPHGDARARPARPRAGRRSPAGIAILACTLLALAIRLYTLTRSGYLTGVTEYDDGVYLGGAIRLLGGALPYRDFAFVQPPGILLLMTPAALLAKVTTTTHALAAARILTAVASAACVPLAGGLVRHRGLLVTLVTGGLLAVYPSDIATAHTLILEPWMNLLALAGVGLAFRRGRLAGPGRLLGAGVAIGAAGSVKFWAGLPAVVLLVVCLLSRDPRPRDAGPGGPAADSTAPDGTAGDAGRGGRAGRYVLGLVIGFGLPTAPFALSAPARFIRATVTDQAARSGTYVPRSMRLAHVTGLIDFLNGSGRLTFGAGRHSLFAEATAAAMPAVGVGLLPYLILLAAVILVAAGYLARTGPTSPLEAFALAVAGLATIAITFYSAFFYHYPDFGAPWIAITAGGAFGALAAGAVRTRPARRVSRLLTGFIAIFLVLVTAFQARELRGLTAQDVGRDQAVIPAGACVVADQVSLTVAADRFTATRPGCPDILDSLAETLVRGDGVSVQGGAASHPDVVAAWRSVLGRADYVWLSPNNRRRIPWTPGLSAWFGAHFTRLPASGGVGRVYQRTGR